MITRLQTQVRAKLCLRDFEVDQVITVGDDDQLMQLLRLLPKAYHEDRSAWRDYVNEIVEPLASHFQTDQVRVRWGQISADQCCLFHTDFVVARVFHTLVGPGTEFLDEENVNRMGLGKGDNEGIVKDWSKVRSVPEGDVIIMKGERMAAGHALVHRSPPIRDAGLRRVYVSMEPMPAQLNRKPQ